MQVDINPLRTTARALPIPQVRYAEQPAVSYIEYLEPNNLRPRILYVVQRILPEDGSWNVVRQRFVEPSVIRRWGVIIYPGSAPRQIVEGFVRTLMGNLNQLGRFSQAHMVSILMVAW
jgi:hypothetical protein